MLNVCDQTHESDLHEKAELESALRASLAEKNTIIASRDQDIQDLQAQLHAHSSNDKVR